MACAQRSALLKTTLRGRFVSLATIVETPCMGRRDTRASATPAARALGHSPSECVFRHPCSMPPRVITAMENVPLGSAGSPRLGRNSDSEIIEAPVLRSNIRQERDCQVAEPSCFPGILQAQLQD